MHHSGPLDLIATFVPLSLMSVGGGQAIIPEIHRQAVLAHHWMTERQFLDQYAISRMSPGPSSLIVLLIGYQADGVLGGLLCTVAIFAPSSLLLYGLARIWARYRGAAWQRAVERGLSPVAAGLILAATLTLFRALSGGWLAVLLAVATGLVLSVSKINPLILIGVSAAIFVVRG